MNYRKPAMILLAIFWLMFMLAIGVYAAPDNTLTISFINAGQGDSALIHDSSGFAVLIDGGKTSAGHGRRLSDPVRSGSGNITRT